VNVIEEHTETVYLRTPVKRIVIENDHFTGVKLANSDEIQRAKVLISNTLAFMVFLGVDFMLKIAPIAIGDGIGIAVPSKVDESLAPKGHASVTLIQLIPEHEAGDWDRKAPGYHARKRAFADEMTVQAERLIPDLSKHIFYRQEASPRTFERYAWTINGSIYGAARSSPRPPLKSPVHGLYRAGSGVFPGPGIEAVVISGVLAADAIYQNDKNFE
jgi:phytoene dehydrogenase-like protein